MKHLSGVLLGLAALAGQCARSGCRPPGDRSPGTARLGLPAANNPGLRRTSILAGSSTHITVVISATTFT